MVGGPKLLWGSRMKLFPPEHELRIYEEGFGDKDLLNRKQAGQRLSELLEKIEDSIVVAVDGPWGSGKSHFLKRWVGAHQIENGGTATTVYFDAFANDFLDDPLIALTGAIGDRLPAGKERRAWKTAKNVAVKLARPVFRIGVAAASAGVGELTGPVVDAVISAGAKETEEAAEAFWRREDGRKAAMQQFRASLTQLTFLSADGKEEGKPLIVVIDELDRCRPDYALSVLETVKHFFSVPRVHFVLGVNMDALEHIVRARYGSGVNAADYLKRFISLSMRLPEFITGREGIRIQLKYFESASEAMGIDRDLFNDVLYQLKVVVEPSGMSLRDIERLLTRLVLLPRRDEFNRFLGGWKILIISLILFQIMRPNLYHMAINGSLKIEDVDEFYGIKPEMIGRAPERSLHYNHNAYIIRGTWLFVLSNGKKPELENEQFSKTFDNSGMKEVNGILSNIERDFFRLFDVTGDTM